jgi:TolB-like protein
MQKREVFQLLFSAALLLTFAVSSFAQIPFAKPHIAVLDLDARDIDASKAATLTDQFRGYLVSLDAFVVLERRRMKEILQEQGFQQTGCTVEECAVRAGQMLNVQKMVAGGIGKVGRTYAINISMVDVESGRIEKSITRKYGGEIEGLLEILRDIAHEMVGKRLLTLKIFSAPKGAEVFINGKLIDKTPVARSVTHGSNLKILLRREGYRDWEKTLLMTGDQEVSAELAPINGKPEKSSSRKWLYIAGGAVAAGAAAAILISSGADDGPPPSSENLPGFKWPPPNN